MLLYLHIPFCDSKCSYCAFNSYVDKFHLKNAYMQAVRKQLDFELERFNVAPQSIQSVFIGGGTPSTVAPELYKPLFKRLAPYLAPDAEITSEANPNSASEAWLEGMYTLGVNRISFGVQSFKDAKLKTLHRAHSAQDAVNALHVSSKIGFKNLSIDLIYGVLGDTKTLLKRDLDHAFSLPISHLSAYALTIEEGTVFENRPQMSKEKLELTQWLFDQIKAHGFTQYEISNFGSYQSRHNRGYWEYKDYIGLGSGAVGFLKNRRFYPSLHVEHYIENPLETQTEMLSAEDIVNEKLLLGLRSDVGVADTLLSPAQRERAALLLREGKLTCKASHYYNRDYLLSDELALFITT